MPPLPQSMLENVGFFFQQKGNRSPDYQEGENLLGVAILLPGGIVGGRGRNDRMELNDCCM